MLTKEERESMLSLTAELKCRLQRGHKKAFFPLAGQEFRDGLIKYFDRLDKEIDDGNVFPPYKIKDVQSPQKVIISWEELHKDLIETINTLDLTTDTEKEREGLRRIIVNIIKQSKPILN